MEVREAIEEEPVTLDILDDGDENETIPVNHEGRIRRWTEYHRDDMSEEDSDVDETEKGVNCTCISNCLDKFDIQYVENHVLTRRELETYEREIFIMASLQKYGNEDTFKEV